MDFDIKKVLTDTQAALDSAPDTAKTALSSSETSGEANPETCSKILESIAKQADKNAKPFEVFFCVSCLLQRGATSPKTPSGTKFEYGGAGITVEQIRKACRDHKTTVRQFARGIKSQIIEVMIRLGDSAPEGNLSKAMKLDLKNVTQDEAIWASDFQTYNNECPTRVKNWLVKNYQARFRK